MDQEKLKTAYHETCHAVMAIICGLKIRRISIKGTETHRGVTSTEPPERQIANQDEALREVRVSLAGFVGEALISGKYSIYRNHSDLTGAIELIEELLAFNETFKNETVKLSLNRPGTLTDIENHLVRAYVDWKISWALRTLTPHKSGIKLIAEKLYEREELTGDEISALYDPLVFSRDFDCSPRS